VTARACGESRKQFLQQIDFRDNCRQKKIHRRRSNARAAAEQLHEQGPLDHLHLLGLSIGGNTQHCRNLLCKTLLSLQRKRLQL
jgi:hypothetical protein